MQQPKGPLRGTRIIDCTMMLAGPYGTALLADLGADVIKVEPPSGDPSRSGPPLPPDYANVDEAGEDQAGVDYGGYFASINRNKRSLLLDFKKEQDRERLLSLAETADALVENMRQGVMDRLGLGYEVLRERNPALVYGCIRGFGDARTGESPYSHWPAYDIVAQSMGGLAHMTGPPGGSGFPCGVSVGDIFPGTLMALGLVSAVMHARQTGEGQFFDVGMYDAILSFNEATVANYGYDGTVLGPRGQHHPYLCPFGIYPARDGGIAIAAPRPGQWKALCEIMAAPELITDPRFANTYKRSQNRQLLDERIGSWTARLTRREILAQLGGKVPSGPVNTAEDIFKDPHVAARNMITRFQLPGQNPEVAIVGSPIKYTKTPGGFYRRPPTLGEHTEEILAELAAREEPQ